MTYDAKERSVQDAQRVEIYTFQLPGVTYRLTSYDEDSTFDGDAYLAAPISRSSVPLAPLGQVREVTVSIALDHPLAVELRRGGIPPQDSLVTIRRFHVGDSEARIQWQGYIGGTSTDDEYTRIRVPNKIDTAFDCQLPVKTVGRQCPHILFDTGCGVDPVAGGFIITPTVASISADGLTITVSSISGKPDAWATHGKIVRTADGEERTVLQQTGTSIVVDYKFRTLEVGDTLEVFAGCDHSLTGEHGCREKFDNVLNYGGEPHAPTNNLFSPFGIGVDAEV